MTLLCEVMGVSRSGFYRYEQRLGRPAAQGEGALLAETRVAFKASKGTYGSRRLGKALQARGYPVGRYQARSLMRRLGLRVLPTRRFRVTTDSRHAQPVAANILDRQFAVAQPDTAWVGDITYLWTQAGWLYLAVMVDLYSRKVVGWALDRQMTTDLVQEALTMAVWRRRPAPGLIHHTDRGCQYASRAYQRELASHGMVCSMSRKGDCWDNAVAERFFRSLKTERTAHRLYRNRNEARRDVIDYIEMFYNSQRLHSYLGYHSPNDFESLALQKVA